MKIQNFDFLDVGVKEANAQYYCMPCPAGCRGPGKEASRDARGLAQAYNMFDTWVDIHQKAPNVPLP